MDFTNGRGVDLVYDQWVGEKLYPEFDLLADFGMVVIYNWLEGEPKENFYQPLLAHAKKCIGIRIYSSHLYDTHPERMKQMQQEVFKLLVSGKVDMKEYFYGNYTLEDVQEAHRVLDAQTAYGKIVLKV